MGFSYGGAGILFLSLLLIDLIKSFLLPLFRFLGLSSSEYSDDIVCNKIPTDEIFPAIKFGSVSRVDPPESCRICQEAFDGEDEVRCLRNCVHVFHRTCLDRWIENDKMTCPLCRALIVPDFYFWRL